MNNLNSKNENFTNINNKKKNNALNIFFSVLKGIKIFILSMFILIAIACGSLGGIMLYIIKESPRIDTSKIRDLMKETSVILDSEGNELTKVETSEYRTYVHLNEIPKNLINAFIAVEDERFYLHNGVDPIGIGKSILDNVKSRSIVRGGSTIAQQLARNLYLKPDQVFERKIKEAYLAVILTDELSKDGVLEAYLNKVFMGQNSYGVQAAAETYFSKDVKDLTLAESAALAGIVKSPSNLSLFKSFRPGDIKENSSKILGDVHIGGEVYKAVFNQNAEARQKYVLKKMLETEKITKEQYEEAISQPLENFVKPGIKKNAVINFSYYTDLVQNQVVEKLMSKLGYTREEAKNKLVNGGLRIYSAIDKNIQGKLENIYDNFSNILLGNIKGASAPGFVAWKVNSKGDILSPTNALIYYKKSNLINDKNNVFLTPAEYSIENNGDVVISSSKINVYGKNLLFAEFYTRNDQNNLVTHRTGGFVIPEENLIKKDGKVIIKAQFLKDKPDLYKIENKNMVFNNKYYTIDLKGIVQPQSSVVVIDHKTGLIKGIVGGRGQKGSKFLNRAASSARQPGSTIKPIAVYTPALANGYTVATPIDDIPYYNEKGERWPNNWYKSYRGLMSLRRSVQSSINVNSVKTLEHVGIAKSKEYLTKMHLINKNNPAGDTFVSKGENGKINDENLAAMGLGAMSDGFTNLALTGAYASISNLGTYIEPLTFTKVVDSEGNVILENCQEVEEVVSQQTAYIMKDVLRTTTNFGVAKLAKIPNMEVGGKTGTTQDNQDSWFIGYTPYYTVGVWLGVDNPQIKLKESSETAVKLWGKINTSIHEGYKPIPLPKPDGITTCPVCTISGKLPGPYCSKDPRGVVKTEIFAEGTVPKSTCNIHVIKSVDKNDGLLATDKTPASEKVEKVFVKRIPPYNPGKNGGIVPEDWKYEAPTKHSNAEYAPPPAPEQPETPPNENPGNNTPKPNPQPEVTPPKPNIPNPDVLLPRPQQ